MAFGLICPLVRRNKTRQQIPFLLFPEGIRYNRISDRCRTTRIIGVFGYLAHVKQTFEQKKRHSRTDLEYASFVEGTGEMSNFLCDLILIELSS
jgi:hypothetical protein